MSEKNESPKYCFYGVKAFRSIDPEESETVILQGKTCAYWTVIAIGGYSEVLHQSLKVFQKTQLLSAKGEILSGTGLLDYLNSVIKNTPITTERIANYSLYPVYDRERKSEISSQIENAFPQDEFYQCPADWVRIGATALEIHDIKIFQEGLLIELQKIDRDWFNVSKEQASGILSALLKNSKFHSELFRQTIPAAWNAR